MPKAVLWLLRFPEPGEENLQRTARKWAGDEVARRIIFTDVAPKQEHITRARVCDLFLDTPECNAHTTAADVLWSSTPLLTLPRYPYKMCSRMAASILRGALPRNAEGDAAARELTVGSDAKYEETAIRLANGLVYQRRAVPGAESGSGSSSAAPALSGFVPAATVASKFGTGAAGATSAAADSYYCTGVGRLADIRRLLYRHKWDCALFDTRRWVADLERAYAEAWRRWEAGEGGDIFL